MSEHTPGPWYVGRSESGYIVCNVGSLEVVTNEYDPEQYDVEADARLIAAAPELLTALKVIAVWAQTPEPNEAACLELIHNKAMESITKAKGDQ